MALLPSLNTPEYELTLPSTGQTLKYRPYLVKEEKVLMIAMESEDSNQMINAVKKVVNECTFNAVDVGKLPMFDLEYMFIKIRGKSVGEVSTVNVKCNSCTVQNTVDIDLEKVDIVGEVKREQKVMLTDTVGMILKYPCIDDVQRRLSETNDRSELNVGVTALVSAIDTIFDEQNTYPADTIPHKELVEYVDNFSSAQMKVIRDAFSSIPKVHMDIDFDCISCKQHNKIELEGLNNFFG